MDFLDDLLGDMEKHKPPPAERESAVDRARKAEIKREMQVVQKDLEKFEADMWNVVKSFVNHHSTIKKFTAVEADKRAIIHDVCKKHCLVSYAFGEEDVDGRIVVAFKSSSAPAQSRVEMMNRSLNYEACIADVDRKIEFDKLKSVEDARENAERKTRPIAVARKSQARLNKLVGDSAAVHKPRTTADYGMVSAEMRADTRTIEEVQQELRKKRQKAAETT
eukprot:m.119278 g.119278  ORF g.119278 m.119278 type:complete len:221 (-) comp28720_c3_seq1:250-912(-)